MALSWIAVALVAVSALIAGANDDAAIGDVITQWPNCTYQENKFKEDLKLEFLLKLFSHNSLKEKLASLKYECAMEDIAGLMIRYPAMRVGEPINLQGYLFRTTFTRPEGNETETEIMDLAATTMKNAFGKKGSTSQFGCNYGRKNGEHVIVCVFFEVNCNSDKHSRLA